MIESVNISVVQTTRVASNVWFTDITGEAEQFAYKNDITIALLTHEAGRERHYRIS